MNSVLFSDEDAGAKQGPALQSRTRDGLNVRLEAREIFAVWATCFLGEAVGNGEIIHPLMGRSVNIRENFILISTD